MDRHSLPSIEKFAAYLDGNLSQSEMQQFSQLAEYNNVLHQLLDATTVVDNTVEGFTDADLQLPPEIVSSDFELPETPVGDSIPDKDYFHMDILNSHPYDDSPSSHHLEPFHELCTNGEITEEVGTFLNDTSNNELNLLDEATGGLVLDIHITPMDPLGDNTNFYLED